MKQYLEYLYQLNYNSSTIKQYDKFLHFFRTWLNVEDLSAENCSYQNLLDFIDHAIIRYSHRTNPRATINRLLVAISHYYDYLIKENPKFLNPARKIRIKNPSQRHVHDLIHESELSSLYSKIEIHDARSVRNKVLLGLLIYQGLSTSEIHRLSIHDLKLRKGTVLIRGGRVSYYRNGPTTRELELEAFQIIDMIEYLENIRPRILAGSYQKLPGRKPLEKNVIHKTNQLLLSIGGSHNLKSSMLHLFRNLKNINPKIKNASQIRQSVIAGWLNRYDLRRVQYMAGHRYVSSTGYYKQIDIYKLKSKIIEYHPLK